MALINCRECGNQMSDKAQSCPKCGAPNPNAPMQMTGYYFNPCAWHSNAPAVASCGKCGKAMCKKCVDSAIFNIDNKPLCNECSLQMLEENIAANKKKKLWSIIKLIFLLFFMAIGLSIYASNPNDIMNAWIYAGIGGLPSTLKSFVTRTAEEKWADEAMSRIDPGEGLWQQMIAFILKIIFAFVFAPIAAVCFIIKNTISIVTCSRAIKADQKDYDAILTLMQETESPNEEVAPRVEQEPQVATIPASAYAPVQPEIPAQQVSPNPAPTDAIHMQPAQTSQTTPVAPSYQAPTPTKRNNTLIIGIAVGAIALVGLIAGYFMWYAPYAKDRDALRTYVVANNVFLRSSKVAGVEYNILSKVPYGSELITYTKDTEWAEIKVNGVKGFVASPYLLEWDDFKLLNDVWGSADTKEYIESSKCRLALLDYCKRYQLPTGNEGWQLYTLQKDTKPNNVLFPRLKNGYDKFTEFAFILKNNATQERRFAIYSFDEESEVPVFLHDEDAPMEGQIKNVKYNNGRNEYNVTYSGNNAVVRTNETYTQPTQNVVKEAPHKPAVEEGKNAIVENDIQAGSNDAITTNTDTNNSDDNKVYETADQMPEFPNGGPTALQNFIRQNLKYPTYCQEAGIQGKVVVSFVINKDGSTSDFKVVWRSAHTQLDNEALRVLKGMPKWKPGKKDGVPVRVKYAVPINFKL